MSWRYEDVCYDGYCHSEAMLREVLRSERPETPAMRRSVVASYLRSAEETEGGESGGRNLVWYLLAREEYERGNDDAV